MPGFLQFLSSSEGSFKKSEPAERFGPKAGAKTNLHSGLAGTPQEAISRTGYSAKMHLTP